MYLRIAKTAGFCYGVRRAIALAEEEAPGGCFVLGELIHNRMEMARLRDLGLRPVSEPGGVPDGASVLIRSHGEPDAVLEGLKARGCRVVDATCGSTASCARRRKRAAFPS